jgi:hypothetical protein
MGGQPGPHGVSLVYGNVKIAITGGIVTVTVTTAHDEKMVQISQESGMVVGGSTAPKTD